VNVLENGHGPVDKSVTGAGPTDGLTIGVTLAAGGTEASGLPKTIGVGVRVGTAVGIAVRVGARVGVLVTGGVGVGATKGAGSPGEGSKDEVQATAKTAASWPAVRTSECPEDGGDRPGSQRLV